MSESPLTNLEKLIITNLVKRGLVSLFYGTYLMKRNHIKTD